MPEAVTLPDPVSTLSTSTSTRSAVTFPDPVPSLSAGPWAPVTITLPDPVSRLTSPLHIRDLHLSRTSVDAERPFGVVGSHVRGRHVDLQVPVDVRDGHAPHRQIHGSLFSRGNRDPQVGVGLEPPPRAGDPHAVGAAARATSFAVVEGPVLPNVE